MFHVQVFHCVKEYSLFVSSPCLEVYIDPTYRHMIHTRTLFVVIFPRKEAVINIKSPVLTLKNAHPLSSQKVGETPIH